MAFYYLKSGGTATGDGGRETTPRPGIWTGTTSLYYGTLSAALGATTGPTAGDIIVWSDASNDLSDVASSQTIPNGVMVVVVDDSNQDQYVKAANFLVENQPQNVYEIQPQASTQEGMMLRGLKWATGSNISFTPINGHTVMVDCAVEQNRFGRDFSSLSRGSCAKFINCDFTWASPTDNGLLFFYSDKLSMMGGSTTVGSGANYHIEGLNYGPNGSIVAHDFSAGKSNIPLIRYGTSASYQQARTHFSNCPLPAAWTIENEGTTNRLYAIIQSCNSRYQYVMECYAGSVDFVEDIFYTAHETLDDNTTKGSFELASNANTNHISPLYAFDISHFEVISAINNNSATLKKVRLHFAVESGDSLEGYDVGAIVFCPNPATPWNHYVVQHYEAPLNASSLLPTETGAWTNNRGGFTLGTQYYLDVDMGSPGDGIVSVIPILFKPNTTALFSWQLEFVA